MLYLILPKEEHLELEQVMEEEHFLFNIQDM